MNNIITGLALAVAASLGARRLRLLTSGGALAATVIGTAIFTASGWGLALTLVGAFALTGAATRYRHEEKRGPEQPEHERGRSALQVLANGLVPAGLAVVGAAWSLPWAAVGALGAIAASTADTLATEIGLLSTTPPRLITTGRVVERGRSGGVTFVGTISGVGGAVAVAAIGLLWHGVDPLRTALAVVLGGVAGLLADSLLGATVQARFHCPACGRRGEIAACFCGARRRLSAGVSWLTNDAVNLLMAAVGAGAAAWAR